jgi:16S rRNA processing protein RimM
VEVLTDHPEARFTPGRLLHREGDDRPLTIAAAEAIADGPGWRLRFREVTTRDAADRLRGAYLETVVRPDEELARGEYYWHEVIGAAVRGVDGTKLGTVRDVYRVGETEVFTVAGGPFGSFDLPAVRAFIRIFAPRRGEIVVDADALDLRTPRSREPDPDRPKAPRRRSRKPRTADSPTVEPPTATPTAESPTATPTSEAPEAGAEPPAATTTKP